MTRTSEIIHSIVSRFLIGLLICTVFILSTSLACSKEEPPIVVPGGSGGSGGSGSSSVASVSLDNTSLSLRLGDSFTLSAYVSPPDASNKSVTWSSSNPSIASVSNGIVTGVSLGQAKITVTTVDGGKTATCDVTVFAPFPVTSITFVYEGITIKEDDSYFLPTSIYPENASVKDLIWSSDNTSVATVVDGTVTAVSPGTAKITVTTVDGGKTASQVITVISKFVPVSSLSLDKTGINLKTGESAQLHPYIGPNDVTDRKVIWSSSDDSVATIKDGLITAINPGTAIITASAGAFTAQCIVVVGAKPVAGISLDKTSATLKVGESLKLSATVSPEDAYDKTVIWSSSNVDMATVKDGVVKAIKSGNNIAITAKTKDGGYTATCIITISAGGLNPTIDDWDEGKNYEGKTE